MERNKFGTCCKDLLHAMTVPPNCLLRVQEDGTLFLSVGYVLSEGGGVGWFDQAVLYCPFCGKKLQDRVELSQRAKKAH